MAKQHYSGRGAPLEAEFYGNGCRGKIGYPSKRAALGRLRALRMQDRHRMSAYKCKACRRWHFGHTPAAKRAAA